MRGPYYLAGWSTAGVFAYEMARQLRSRGKEVLLVTLFDTPNPAYWRSYQGWRWFAIRVYLRLEKVRNHLRKARGILFGEAWRYFPERMKSSACRSPMDGQGNGVPEGAGKEPWRIQYRTVFGYRPGPCDSPVVLFRSPVSLQRGSVSLQKGWFRDLQLGWGPVARGGLTDYEMPGEHDTMFLEPHAQRLAALWKECAQRVSAAGKGACSDLVVPGPGLPGCLPSISDTSDSFRQVCVSARNGADLHHLGNLPPAQIEPDRLVHPSEARRS